MVKAYSFVAGMGCCLILVACAGATFNYKYYGFNSDVPELLGPTAKDDLALDVCKATSDNQAPCIVVLQEEFFKLKKDYMDQQTRLLACEGNK